MVPELYNIKEQYYFYIRKECKLAILLVSFYSLYTPSPCIVFQSREVVLRKRQIPSFAKRFRNTELLHCRP